MEEQEEASLREELKQIDNSLKKIKKSVCHAIVFITAIIQTK
jgi:hypothetical protein